MHTSRHEQVHISQQGLRRRSFLHSVSAGACAAGTLSLRDLLSLQAADLRRQGRSLILLWMAGGPSQFETFDPKPDDENGGSTPVISTTVPGIQVAAGWEQTAKSMADIALIRSLTNNEGNHQRTTYQMHTGYIPSGSVKHPSFAANIAHQIADSDLDLPSVVSIGQTQGAGFLGVRYEPFVVAEPGRMPQNVTLPVPEDRYRRRLGLFNRLEGEFAGRGAEQVVENQRQLYARTADLVLSDQKQAFDLSAEPETLRRQYGETRFGRGCLLARRLVESGVTFVEVISSGWDTHDNNFERIDALAGEVDPGMSSLIADLKQRGLLERTVVLWMGEFGRTPRVNARGGRDHYPRVFNAAIAGGGIRGGQVIGSSTADGTAVADRPLSPADLFCSVCQCLEVDPHHENISPLGRPMKIVDGGEVIPELFA